MQPYYQDDAVTIYHGDCRDIVPTLGKFDLLLTVPPYGIGIAANPVRQKHARRDWDNSPASHQDLACSISATSHQVIWGGNYFGLPAAKCFLVWDKMQPQDFSLAMCEMAYCSFDLPAKMFRKSVLSYTKTHPTEKPLELMTWCISLLDGDNHETFQTILDPFAGSGTTGRAAKDLGRKATLIEREEKYCEIAARRMAQEVFKL